MSPNYDFHNTVSIQSQIRSKIGEVSYTIQQIENMLGHMELSKHLYSYARISKYVKKNNLAVDLDKLSIDTSSSHIQYWVPKSKLEKIIDGLKIPVNLSDFEKAAFELGYQGDYDPAAEKNDEEDLK